MNEYGSGDGWTWNENENGGNERIDLELGRNIWFDFELMTLELFGIIVKPFFHHKFQKISWILAKPTKINTNDLKYLKYFKYFKNLRTFH